MVLAKFINFLPTPMYIIQIISKNLSHCLENHTEFHLLTRNIVDNEGEYESFNIGGNSILRSVHTSESDM